jgi:hypothetical protein
MMAIISIVAMIIGIAAFTGDALARYERPKALPPTTPIDAERGNTESEGRWRARREGELRYLAMRLRHMSETEYWAYIRTLRPTTRTR